MLIYVLTLLIGWDISVNRRPMYGFLLVFNIWPNTFMVQGVEKGLTLNVAFQIYWKK